MSLEFSKFVSTKEYPKLKKGFVTLKVKDPTFSRDASITLEILFENEMKEIVKATFSSFNDGSADLGTIYAKNKEQSPFQIIKGLDKNAVLQFFIEG